MTVNFSLLALDQIVNNAATLCHMSGGQMHVPIVIRMATGAGRQLAAQHSHSLEVWYAHVPGLRVVAPATIDDARGLLRAALASPDPVIIFEPISLYNMEGELTAAASEVRLEGARVHRPGSDVTLVTYGASLWRCADAANELASGGIEAEIIDLRSLRPLDDATILASAAQDTACRDRRRRLAYLRSLCRDRDADRGAGLLRPGRADRARLRRGGADPVSEASRGGGAASPARIVAAVKRMFSDGQ